MFHEFISLCRDEIIARTRAKLVLRPWPSVTAAELESGVPLFLTQLSNTLRAEMGGEPVPSGQIGDSAARHGGELRALGLTVSQVVQDYGDICQAITEVAVEKAMPITAEEFHTLNRCLDTAIAEAVTEHARMTAKETSGKELVRLGQLAHEARNMLNSAMLAFTALKRGDVAVNGSTGTVLGQSLIGLRDLIDRTLSEVRLDASRHERHQVPVASFLDDFSTSGCLHAEYAKMTFTLEPGDPELYIDIDPQLAASAVMNLLSNAFKYSNPGGHVTLRSRLEGERVLIEVEDECGGMPDTKADPFMPFGQRRGKDRSGLGLGLSIARKAIRAHGGDITIHNMPGKGCVFTIDLPLANAPALPTAV